MVGYNHRFGHNKAGDYSSLKESGTKLEIHRVEQQLLDEGKVSSTVVRQRVEKGDMLMANRLLSHPYIIMGEIDNKSYICNIDQNKLLPPTGKYEAILRTINGDNKHASSNIHNLSKVLLEVERNRILKINSAEEYCSLKVILEITSDKLL